MHKQFKISVCTLHNDMTFNNFKIIFSLTDLLCFVLILNSVSTTSHIHLFPHTFFGATAFQFRYNNTFYVYSNHFFDISCYNNVPCCTVYTFSSIFYPQIFFDHKHCKICFFSILNFSI